MSYSSNQHGGVQAKSVPQRKGMAVFLAGVLLATGSVLGFTPVTLEANAATSETVSWVAGEDSTGPNLFTVPVGATNLKVKIWGGAGGDGYTTGRGAAGVGGGGLVMDGITLDEVEAGDILEIYVGSGGTTATGKSGGAGGAGWTNGAKGREGAGDGGGGGGGGGSSAILLDGIPLVVSAGGGGGGGAGDRGTGSGSGGKGGFYNPARPDTRTGNGDKGSTSSGGNGGSYAANSNGNGTEGGFATQLSGGGGGGGGGAGYTAGGTGGGGASWDWSKIGGGGGGGAGNSFWNTNYVGNPNFFDASSWGGGVPGQVIITYDLAISSTVSATSSAVYVGETASYEVTVTPEDQSTPAGQVCITFPEGDSCTTTLSADNKYVITRQSTVNDLGSKDFTVTYTPSGASYSVATGTVTAETLAIPSATTVVVDPATVLVDDNVTFTATVSLEKSSDFDGTVTFQVWQDGTMVSEVTESVDSAGQASTVLSTLPAGAYEVTASYAHADGAVEPSTSDGVAFEVTKREVQLEVVADPPLSSKYGDPISLAVETSSSSTTVPTGTVRVGYVQDGIPTVLAEDTLSDGEAVFADVANWPWGEADFTVWYLGDDRHVEASSVFDHEKTAVPSNLDVSQLPETSFVDEEVSFAVTPNLESETVTGLDGTVTLKRDGDVQLDSKDTTEASGTPVSLTATFGEAGDHDVAVTYDDNRDFVAAASQPASHTVLKHETSVDISGVGTVAYGDDISGEVTITPTTGTHVSSVPTGQVSLTLLDGDEIIYQADPSTLTEGKAALEVLFADLDLTPGTYTLQVSYGSDRAHEASVSAVPVTVSPSTSSVALSVVQTSIKAGQPIDFEAALSVVGPGHVDGSIEFLLDDEVVATVPISVLRSSSDVISYCLQNGLSRVSDSVKVSARYIDAGGEVVSSSSLDVFFSVEAVPTKATVTGAEGSTFGKTATFDIAVTNGEDSTLAPTGNVQLFAYAKGADQDSAKALGDPIALDANGKVSAEVQNLAVGNYVVYAEYLGDSVHESALSTTVAHKVSASSNSKDNSTAKPSPTTVKASGKLAKTGSTALIVVLIAGLSVAAGGTMVVVRRKRMNQ